MVKDKNEIDLPVEGEVVDKKSKNTGSAVAVVDKPKRKKAADRKDIVKRDSAFSIVGNVTTDQLKKALEVQTEQRKLIEDFIKAHLREGTDYGRIHIVNKDRCPDENRKPGSCEKSYHFSKSILLKPGQEKIFSLFSITDELVRDEETLAMLPDTKGLVAFKCIMYQKGKKIGEGRGAATLQSERSDPNSTIKKAEKRARMDACLSLGFSEYFTQDLDDPEYASQRELANAKAAAEAERRDKDQFGLFPRDSELPIDNDERTTLHRILLTQGFDTPDRMLALLKANGIDNPASMTSGQARDLMAKVSTNLFNVPEMPPEPQETPHETVPTPPPEPELVVDDDFKQAVKDRFEEMTFTGPGKVWFAKRSIGKLNIKWESITDKEWRMIYETLEAIQNHSLKVEDHHIQGVMTIEDENNDDETKE